jgi:PhnB protein
MSDTKTVPAHMDGVIPYLGFNGQAGAAADLYLAAFAGEDQGRVPSPRGPGRFMHIQIKINGGVIMLSDHPDDAASGFQGGHLQLVVIDGQAWWDRAIAAGMTPVMPYEMQPWGDRWGLVRDAFGVQWAIMQIDTESFPG